MHPFEGPGQSLPGSPGQPGSPGGPGGPTSSALPTCVVVS